jgi:hypothetical protein
MEGLNGFGHFLRRLREEREMMLTELTRRVEISIACLSPGRSIRGACRQTCCRASTM